MRLIGELRHRAIDLMRLVLLPFLIVTAVAVKICLSGYLSMSSPRKSALHSKAIESLDLFLEQYPFHLYPILCKCLELAYLQFELPPLVNNRERILEIAIGEGSFSKLIFPPDAGIVGLELNPYYLHKSS